MSNKDTRNYDLQRLLCAKAKMAIDVLTRNGMVPDPRLMAAVEAKLAYLAGRISPKELEAFRAAADKVRVNAQAALVNAGSEGGSVREEAVVLEAISFAAEAAVCAAGIDEVEDVDDPLIEAMLAEFLRTGKTTTDINLTHQTGSC